MDGSAKGGYRQLGKRKFELIKKINLYIQYMQRTKGINGHAFMKLTYGIGKFDDCLKYNHKQLTGFFSELKQFYRAN